MEKMNSLVSIIMPAYNCDKYITYSIKSVLDQTYDNWELLICDDGSSDKTIEIVQNYIDEDCRIKLFINKTNLGVSATRNKLLEKASGQWIAFLDSDDIWANNKLEIQLNAAQKNKVDFLFTGASYINEKGEFYKGKFLIPTEVSYETLRLQNVISCSSVLLNKSLINDIRFGNDSIHEDFAMWLSILKQKNVNAYGINESLLIYRITKNSKSGNKLKTLTKNYKMFRYLELTRLKSIYFTINNAIGGVKKYNRILI